MHRGWGERELPSNEAYWRCPREGIAQHVVKPFQREVQAECPLTWAFGPRESLNERGNLENQVVLAWYLSLEEGRREGDAIATATRKSPYTTRTHKMTPHVACI